MLFYPLARSLLFRMDAERAHALSLRALDEAARLGFVKPGTPRQVSPRTVMGLHFPNPLGIAAGLDKNAQHLPALQALGVGFVEVGTVTPRPQPGNPRPRLFRLPSAAAVINRFGFNNEGVDALVDRVQDRDPKQLLGINIGKNFDTPLEHAIDDYLLGLHKVHAHADYVTINISSPNTKNLRQLQQGPALHALLAALKNRQRELAEESGRYVPIAVKIAPDLAPYDLDELALELKTLGLDAVIATNTTLDRSAVQGLPHAEEAGGLSGAPLFERSLTVVQRLSGILQGTLPIIGVGGINSAQRARAMLEAGASLIQVYTGLVYEGPALVERILESLND